MAIQALRQDTWDVELYIEDPDAGNGNLIAFGTFDKLDGGGKDSDENKYRPGNMQPQISLGGPINFNNITIQRNYRAGRDADQVKRLLSWVGRARCTCVQQPLLASGHALGAGVLTYYGVLKAVTPPTHDSESATAAMLSLEISVDAIT